MLLKKNPHPKRTLLAILDLSDSFIGVAGTQKGADSYFPPEDRVRLVRLVSHGGLPGERSGESIVEYSWNNL